MNKTGILFCLTAVACSTPQPGSHTSGGVPRFPGAGTDGVEPFLNGVMECYEDPANPGVPIATIEHVLEVFDEGNALRVRLTLDPLFVDNTYGANAIGWEMSKKGKHTFKDLVGSDHAVLDLYGTDDALLELKLDYLSQDDSAPSGYASQGVWGGEGDVLKGNIEHVIATSTSLDRNLNERELVYTTDSPETDRMYTPNPAAPGWDFRVVYETWIDPAAFPAGFDRAAIEFIHASPSKTEDNTVVVEPGDCPPDWCNDPDGCDHGPWPPVPAEPPPECMNDEDCSATEFCAEDGTCRPVVD